MPLFNNTFSSKKASVRKSSSAINNDEHLEALVGENRSVRLRLDNHESVFENGKWAQEPSRSGSARKAHQKLESRIHELEEENNLLKLKFEIMVNMLTQTTAESHLQQREILKLRKITRKNK